MRTPANDAISKAQADAGRDPSRVLTFILDTEIRWTSLHSMVDRYLVLDSHHFIYPAMSQCNGRIDILNREKLAIMRDIRNLTQQ